ncbi:carbohydrate binding family 9 domain-containing protein [Aggregatimonas sangjinii]|uniref:Carbohydrate binding family 9 domain-containing protein n=1 Tax=Aggregatimonas sangjinii TaxID=2583587 RepID=A0A5B7SQJ3_9FLAO|nr:carbohydrate binding family 9 domain-containing protein [Aggregatimonas sangjinii]QCW99252.1 carbohydrate binding family 9 domain-containing protein [Aggregatimonas sangjinii]
MTKLSCALALFFCSLFVFSQTANKSFVVKYTDDIAKVDGILDEAFWETAESAKDFQQYFPSDSILATQPTDIKMVYNATTLYIGITIESVGNDWVIPTLQRDFRAGGNDNISLLFDTFNDGTNAFLFGINPYGVRREALISGGGQDTRGFTTSWDVKWKGEVVRGENSYTAELAIPLTSFKFREGETKWRFQSYRFDQQTNEQSVWYNIPQNQLIFSLAFMGDMVFEKPLGRSRTPLALIPYVNAITERDFEIDEGNTNVKVGGDAKVAIGNGMNLDITVNPDFSNVEVDDIVTNLTRFEIGLPEKRQFFIDNSDLFGSFGGGRDANPFFSRRIGIANDTTGNSIENRILGGVRLSGKLTNDWRLGFLSIQTDEDLDNEIASNNNTMLAIQKKVFARSNIGAFFINRETFKEYDFLAPEDKFNRVIGIDYNLASADNVWQGKAYLHKSFQPDDSNGNLSGGAFLGRSTRFFNIFTDWVYIDDDFQSDLGFIRRTDIVKSATQVETVFWPKSEHINNYSFALFPIVIWRPELDYQKTDHDIRLSGQVEMQNQTQFSVGFTNTFTFLTAEDDNFVPSRQENGIPLPNLQGYHYNSLNFAYQSNRAQVFSYQLESTIGRFFNGDLLSMQAELALRLQPKALISLQLNYDKISLPDPYPSADLWLISPKIQLTFSKSLFWSTLIQYSNQRDNLGINSRVQWRFAPLSDLFIVYNDNYFVNQFSPRFRSINLKLTYWLNI